MDISAKIRSRSNLHETVVSTNGISKHLDIPIKAGGFGSAVNGGEMLLLSLATCFCNDLYREAAKKGIAITDIEINVTGQFRAEGEPGSNFNYEVKVISPAPAEEIEALVRQTDSLAEVHNTLRQGLAVKLRSK